MKEKSEDIFVENEILRLENTHLNADIVAVEEEIDALSEYINAKDSEIHFLRKDKLQLNRLIDDLNKKYEYLEKDAKTEIEGLQSEPNFLIGLLLGIFITAITVWGMFYWVGVGQ